MSVKRIQATIECDGCGKQFKVDIDEGYSPPAEWTMFDVAEDAVCSGYSDDIGFCSVQDDLQLCTKCTSVADSIGDEDYKPKRDEILEKLGCL